MICKDCGTIWKIDINQNKEPDEILCDCGGTMKKRNGKFGEFYGCSEYPKCKNTQNV